MALCPFAEHRLLPESRTQPGIVPTQVIDHTIVGTVEGADAHFRNSASTETHFGIRKDGSIVQWMDTEVRADGNYKANRRPDGTGAVSIETAGFATEEWTDAQVDALVRLHVWLAKTHLKIGHRATRTGSDPGFGYHVMHGSPGPWTPVAKSCPGPKRIKQWHELVLPRTLAALRGEQEDDMPSIAEVKKAVAEVLEKERDEQAQATAAKLLNYLVADPADGKKKKLVDFWRWNTSLHLGTRNDIVKRLAAILDPTKLAEALAPKLGAEVDKETVKQALREVFADAATADAPVPAPSPGN